MDIKDVFQGLKIPDYKKPDIDTPDMLKSNSFNTTQSTIDDYILEKLNLLNIPKETDSLIRKILTLENNKKYILCALKIPQHIETNDVLQALIDMKIEKQTFNNINSLKLIFKYGTPTVIMDIITKALYTISGASTQNMLKLAVVNSDGEPLERRLRNYFFKISRQLHNRYE